MTVGAVLALAVGSAQALQFQGYEVNDAAPNQNPADGGQSAFGWNGFAYNNAVTGASVTQQLNGTGGVPGLSGAYYGLAIPGAPGSGIDGAPYDSGGRSFKANNTNENPPMPYLYQNFYFLDADINAGSGSLNNQVFWSQISHNTFNGVTYSDANTSHSYRFGRTGGPTGNVANNTWFISEAGGNGLSTITVPANAWYGIYEVYSINGSGFAQIDYGIVDATGTVLISNTDIFDGLNRPLTYGTEFAGFRTNFYNRFDDTNNIRTLGLPMDNTGTVLGTQVLIPPLAPIPEPASLLVLGAGFLLLCQRRRD